NISFLTTEPEKGLWIPPYEHRILDIYRRNC
ncbi:hypothetical protein Gotur_027795, partial [Gossypium turneri]